MGHDQFTAVSNQCIEQHRAFETKVMSDRGCNVVNWLKPPLTNEKKRVAKKSVKMLVDTVGDEKARMFVSGKNVELTGQKYTFVLKQKGLGLTGHGGLDLSLKENNGPMVANMCCYFPDTPVIEQLVAIAWHVAAGADDLIIGSGNLSGLVPSALEGGQEFELTTPDEYDKLINTPQFQQLQSYRKQIRADHQYYFPTNDKDLLQLPPFSDILPNRRKWASDEFTKKLNSHSRATAKKMLLRDYPFLRLAPKFNDTVNTTCNPTETF